MNQSNLDPIDVLARQLVRRAPSFTRAAAMRSALVQAAAGHGASSAGSQRRRISAGIAALAAAAALVLIVRATIWTSQPVDPYRGRIIASDGAVYHREGSPGHEVVHLQDGVMRFEVTPLRPGEQFHVVVGDHRVEVRGTVFHVVACHDQLVSVSVARGRVDVIAPHQDVTHLAVGESWPVTAVTAAIAPEPVVAPREIQVPPPVRVAPPVPVRRRADMKADREPPQRTVDPSPAKPPVWPGESEFRDGWSAYQRGDYGQAAQWLRTSCRDAENSDLGPDACFWYAVSLDRGGQVADAISAYRSFRQHWPNERRSDEARIQLATLLVADGDRDAARVQLREAARSPRSSIRDAALQALRALDGAR